MSKNLANGTLVLGFGSLVILVLVAYWFVSPYSTVLNLREALVAADERALGEVVDFTTLRQNLKDQVKSQMDRMAIEEGESPLALAGSALAGLFTDRLIDAYITPSGLVQLATKGEKPGNANSRFTDQLNLAGAGILNQGDYVIDRSFNFFSVRIQNQVGEEIELIFERNGLQWMLVNIILPKMFPGRSP